MLRHTLARPALMIAVFLSLGNCTDLIPQAIGQVPSNTLNLELHPQSIDPSLMKYRLLPSAHSQLPGNAAVWYGAVFSQQGGTLEDAELWSNARHAASMPLEAILEADFAKRLMTRETLFGFLDKAAHSRHCDWQLQTDSEPQHRILIPQIQQTRNFSRLIVIRTRFQIAQGKFDDAIKTLNAGFALSRNVGKGRFMVCSLAASEIAGSMIEQTLELISQPGAPNIYWALADLPRPLVDIRVGLDSDITMPERSFEAFRNVDRNDLDASYWQRQLEIIWQEIKDSSRGDSLVTESLASHVLRAYPVAKRRLIHSGMRAKEVESMPTGQVVLLQAIRDYRIDREIRYAYSQLSYPNALRKLKEYQAIRNGTDEVLPLSTIFGLPYASAIRAQMRPDVSIALARTIEALRDHLEVSGGRLPDSLSEIKRVPVPNDPSTGSPFEYKKTDGSAVMTTGIAAWSVKRIVITVAGQE